MPRPVFEDEILGKAFDSRLTRKALVFLVPHVKPLLVALVATLVTTAANLVPPYLSAVAIDRGIGQGNYHVLAQCALLYLGTYIIYWGFQYIQGRILSILSQHVIFDIRHTLFQHLTRQSLEFFDNIMVGRLISRIVGDVGSLNQFLTSGLITLVNGTFQLVGIILIMIHLNAKLTMVSMAMLPLVMTISLVFRGKVRRAYKNVRIKAATVTAHVAENVTGVKAVKSFSREKENLKRFERVNTENSRAVMRAVTLSSILNPILMTISIVAAAIIYLYGGYQIQAGVLKVGIVVAFIGYTERFFQPINQLSQLYHTMQGAMAGAERIFEILDREPAIQDKPDAIEMPPIEGDVEFRNVTFAYRDDPVLKDVSFKVKAGETIALVGPTGAGKTTIISLLARQYEIEQGEILIDGHDIRDVKMASIRSQVSVVLQDSFLFPISVKENIRYGNLDATDQEVEAAAKDLGVDEFICNLPQGFKTEVHEGASKLSTGQKQLVAFVRALIANPRILILDEATSSIDTYTELLIQQALSRLLKGRTSFVIAHRLSTIFEADRIMVIDDGRIAETGTHRELLELGGVYRRLYDAQFRELIGEETAVAGESQV